MIKLTIQTFIMLVFINSICIAQNNTTLPIYKNSKENVENRVTDLLSKMTLEEKIDLLSGAKNKNPEEEANSDTDSDSPVSIVRAINFQSRTKPNIRLGIPQFVMTDGPLGPNAKGGSTNYSSSINMAATFDDDLIYNIAQKLGAETRDLGYNTLLAPMINLARTPFNGRMFESFGEDPYLMSRMAVSYVKGVQSQRVITCTKTFIANNQEWNRMSVDVDMDERTLREIYLPAFKAVVQEADAWTIMTPYNQVMGYFMSENKYLLQDVLKDQLGFTGVVVSDWGGVHSTVPTLLAGTDLEMPTGRYLNNELILPEIKNGTIKVALINDKVSRILRIMFKAGLFDETVATYGGLSNTAERRNFALEVAEKSIILLKNTPLEGMQNNILPLKMEAYKKIAIIGPNGATARITGGGSGANFGHYAISLLDGVKNKYDACTDIEFKRGIAEAKLELPIIPSSMFLLPKEKGDGNGVWAEYYNNRDLKGKPDLARKEEQINFNWGFGAFRDPAEKGSPDPDIIQTDRWSARWTGRLKSPGEGWYDIGLNADNGVRLYLDGKLIIDAWTDQAPGKFKITQFQFEQGRIYDLKIEFYENWGSSRCIFGLEKFKPSPATIEAITLAKNSDLVIMGMGLNAEMEGEAKDRDRLALPKAQIDLIKSVAEVNKNVVVVLNGGTPILMSEWIDDVPAIINTLYPGQEGGNAVANILFGDVSPSGKLPVTFPKKWEDSPVANTYPGDRDYLYHKEGIFVGYRHFDKENIEPLFPFGFGLSYTTFEFSDLRINKTSMGRDDELTIELTLKNTGKVDGAEVVQLYIHDKKSSVEREVKSLKGYKRVHLKVGESKTVSLKVDRSALEFYDMKSKSWVVESGEFEILIGNSSRNILLKKTFEIN